MIKTETIIERWTAAKAQYTDSLLMVRLGDYYELFGEDARVAGRELELTVTSREKGNPNALPMCGVPYHSVVRHMVTLMSRGFWLAVMDAETGEVEKCSHALLTAAPTVARHTPGPWQFNESDRDNEDGGFINIYCQDNASAQIAEVVPTFGYASADIANARLIAAAPELLAALQEAEFFMGGFDDAGEDRPECLDRVRAAITKATG